MSRTNGHTSRTGKPLDTLKLYELSSELEAALIMTEDNPTFDPERFRALELAFEDKLEGCAKAIKNLEATEKAVRDHIKTQQAKAAALKNNAKGIREYVKRHLERNKIQRLYANTHKFSVQDNTTPTVTIIDETKLDPEWLKIERKPKVKAIADNFLETGEEPDGTEISVGTHLRLS